MLKFQAIRLQIKKWMKIPSNITLMNNSKQINFETNLFKLNDGYINLLMAKNKDYYPIFLQSKTEVASSHKYWDSVQIKKCEKYKNSLLLAQLACSERTILAFHFKLIHNILPTGVNLKKWGIKDVAKCDKCGDLEDTKHVFWQCNETKNILSVISDILNLESFNDEIKDVNSFIFGVENMQVNSLLLFVKHFIYDLKKSDGVFKPQIFKNEISLRMFSDKKVFTIEKYIRKWGNLNHLYIDYEEGIL